MSELLRLVLFIAGYFMVGFGLATFAAWRGLLGADVEKIKEFFPALVVCWPVTIIIRVIYLLSKACGAWVDYLFRSRN